MFLLRDCITRNERDLTSDTSDLMALHLLPCKEKIAIKNRRFTQTNVID
jgi:hypothetical protein